MTFARARASKLARDTQGLPGLPRWLGHHGGSHVVQDASGRLFLVDLVLRTVTLMVGDWRGVKFTP